VAQAAQEDQVDQEAQADLAVLVALRFLASRMFQPTNCHKASHKHLVALAVQADLEALVDQADQVWQ